jgi:hypothetical protein
VRSSKTTTDGRGMNVICLPAARRIRDHIGLRPDNPRRGDRQPSSVLDSTGAVVIRTKATLTATPAGTSGSHLDRLAQPHAPVRRWGMPSDRLPGPPDQGSRSRTGAILGARPHSRPRTTMDTHGAQTAVPSVKADSPNPSGRLVETYGSEGWEFESPRVRHRPLTSGNAGRRLLVCPSGHLHSAAITI